jgi:hypothetical protein
MSYRRLLVLTLLAVTPSMVWAQFTTFIPPQSKAADSAKTAVVAQQRAKSDSIVKVQLADMKTWVDSAAGVLPSTTAASDSVATVPVADPDTLVHASSNAVASRRGERAPATASDLPLLALIGTIALAIGTVMLAGTQLGRDRG